VPPSLTAPPSSYSRAQSTCARSRRACPGRGRVFRPLQSPSAGAGWSLRRLRRRSSPLGEKGLAICASILDWVRVDMRSQVGGGEVDGGKKEKRRQDIIGKERGVRSRSCLSLILKRRFTFFRAFMVVRGCGEWEHFSQHAPEKIAAT
jgi:hypothetical protein